ncbi:NAD(P)H-binding protein [Cellulophaga sp. HaHaR_3_176]|uniref:NAD(P)H-binding protein n=1 Tax=Cellulophaga sp. HaHaR_3_176 TaxID=1942464 RepID=UPI001C1FE3B7|nr:NAD(P)H-binding protein [Cellulophaga sp. HaHaR_3_176]QWX83889.1 NAD(P)H-binding protein [Cellulophaga sp. HaHaR_3_176]
MSNTIAIIGCGWLGLPLAKEFIKENFTIKGSTTSPEKINLLKKEGIEPYLIKLNEGEIEGSIHEFLKNVDTIIINVPPRLRGVSKENYVSKMHLLHSEIKRTTIKNVVFISSTSVYGDIDGEVTEKTIPEPATESGKQLIVSENIFKNDSDLKVSIIRFGGLVSEDRHPVTMLSKKDNLSNGNMPINLIHRNDCTLIIKSVIKNCWWDTIINGVYPYHPKKQDYYKKEAIKRNLKAPKYEPNSSEKGKIIVSEFLINHKKFKFLTSIRN